MRRTTKGILMPALRAIREGQNITRKQVSESIGIDISTLYRIETGRTGAAPQTASDLAGFFAVPIQELQKNIHSCV